MEPAFDGGTVVIGRRDEFGPRLRTVDAAGVSLIVLRRHGRLAAARNRCPHAERRLDDAALKGWKIICPGHGRSWDLRPGRQRGLLALEHVRIAETSDGDVVVALADLLGRGSRPPSPESSSPDDRSPGCGADGRGDR